MGRLGANFGKLIQNGRFFRIFYTLFFAKRLLKSYIRKCDYII